MTHNKTPLAALVVAAIIVTTTILATSIAGTNDTLFAKKNHGSNQALSQVNNAGNGEVPFNVGSQNIASQIQGDENEIALSSKQVFLETTEAAP